MCDLPNQVSKDSAIPFTIHEGNKKYESCKVIYISNSRSCIQIMKYENIFNNLIE